MVDNTEAAALGVLPCRYPYEISVSISWSCVLLVNATCHPIIIGIIKINLHAASNRTYTAKSCVVSGLKWAVLHERD